eukprot:gb/GECG01001341.1/.p1 GENE.gb/GECG01001341.1/~~gb/GECG01001341.1/.p1  ORF type:complete len:494 (+),score=63.77 gb/GECG01001341.1/:1-1482(+)
MEGTGVPDEARRLFGLLILVPPLGDDSLQEDLIESVFPPVRFLVSMARRFGGDKIPICFVDGSNAVDILKPTHAAEMFSENPSQREHEFLSDLNFPERSLTELLKSLSRTSEDYLCGVDDCDRLHATVVHDLSVAEVAVCGTLGKRDDCFRDVANRLQSTNVKVSVCADCSMISADTEIDVERVFSTDVIGQWLQKLDKRISAPPLTGLGEGDSMVIYDALGDGDCASRYFHLSKDEIEWQTMAHRGGSVPRLISIQGDITGEGSDVVYPIYRHPADEQPTLSTWSSTARIIRDEMNELLNEHFNHALIQYYRGGNDYISEHSDKTIDVKAFSNIINVSLGAARTMVLREKQTIKGTPRKSNKFILPHNSVFVLGWKTNRKFLHSIRQDKRPETEKTPEEKDFSEERISFTFRSISTFVHQSAGIFGQGSKCKNLDEARKREITGKEDCDETRLEQESLLYAFGNENKQTNFNWLEGYGRGFDVVNFSELQPS